MSSCSWPRGEHEGGAVGAHVFVLVERRLDAGPCSSGRRTRRRTASPFALEALGALGDALVHVPKERFGAGSRSTLLVHHASPLRASPVRDNARAATTLGVTLGRVDELAGAGGARRRGVRERGVDARLEEFREGTPTAAAAARRRRLRAGADRQVARLHLRRAAGARARARRPARGRGKIAAAAGRGYARVARPRGGRRGDGLRARRRRAVPARRPSTRVLHRARAPASRARLGGAGSTQPHGRARADRPRAAHAGGRRGSARRLVDPGSIRGAARRREETAMQETSKIWMNGELVDWADATVHVGTHGLHYGSGVFEGIRAYETPRGTAVFRLTEHIAAAARLGEAPLHGAAVLGRGARRPRRWDLVGANGLPACYLRPIAFFGYGAARRRRRAATRSTSRSCRGRGALPRRGGHAQRASARRSRAGSASGRTSSRTSRRRPASTSTRCSRSARRTAPATRRRSCSRGRLHRRRLGREHLRRQGRRHLHARPLRVDPRRHHARHGDPDRAGSRPPRRREAADPHRSLSRRRGLHGAARPPR